MATELAWLRVAVRDLMAIPIPASGSEWGSLLP
jgi:hypothetical protein